jgi:replicative DNA helicase
MSESLKKIPHALGAERCVLGAVLVNPGALIEAQTLLKPQDFFSDAHRRIFAALNDLQEREKSTDLTTVCDALESAGELEAVGGPSYVSGLLDEVGPNIESACKLIRDKAVLRALMYAAENVVSVAAEGGAVEEVLELAERSIFELSQRTVSAEAVSFQRAAYQLLQSFDDEDVIRVRTGIDKLDEKTGGFRKGELVIYCAETGVGKTLLAQQTRRHACAGGLHSLIASAEMAAEQLVARELAAESEVPPAKMRNPEQLEKDEHRRLLQQIGSECGKCRILDGEITVSKVRHAARRLAAQTKLGLVVLDYDELIEGPGKDDIDRQKNVVVGAKRLAVELGCPVILISQLRKSVAGVDRSFPTLQRLYGTGAKVKHAHMVIYVDRPWVTTLKGEETEAMIYVLKNRDGRMGKVKATFNVRTLRFEADEDPVRVEDV